VGHNLEDVEEYSVCHITPTLQECIRYWAEFPVTNQFLLNKSVTWARNNGHNDAHDRRYYVTIKDIKNIRATVAKDFQEDPNDAVSVSKLCGEGGALKEQVVFYQALDQPNEVPLVLILQTPWQREQLKKYGQEVAFLDATYSGITAYGFGMYSVVVQNAHGCGVPTAFLFLSDEKEATLFLAMAKLKESLQQHGFAWQPR